MVPSLTSIARTKASREALPPPGIVLATGPWRFVMIALKTFCASCALVKYISLTIGDA
jgi:hypothetical protein